MNKNPEYVRHWIFFTCEGGQKEKYLNFAGVRCNVSHVRGQVWGVRCQVSGVRWEVSHVTCYLSLMPIVGTTDLPPANSPIVPSRLDGKYQKNQNNRNHWNGKKNPKQKRYGNVSNMLFDQKTPVHQEAGVLQWQERRATDIATEWVQRADLVKLL